MELGELITALEAENPNLVVPHGFTSPHSYRGYYDQIAFEPASNVAVAAMLTEARSAVGHTFEGYKGGDFAMGEDTDCWLAIWGCIGEELGPTMLRLMLAAGAVPAETASAETEALTPETITVYASIGNSDDKLTQERWARLVDIFNEIIERYAEQIHGVWFSEPSSRWQNTCVAFTIPPDYIAEAKEDLADIARRYGQDSIAWAPVPETEFIRPAGAVSRG